MKSITPSAISGSVTAPPSKSVAQRAMFAAALSDGPVVLRNPSHSADCLACLSVIEGLGCRVQQEQSTIQIAPAVGMRRDVLDCGESGLCLRMSCAVAALLDTSVRLLGHGSLTSRPVQMIEAPLTALGVRVTTTDGKLPISLRGPMSGGKARVDGSVSSQFLSGLLMALPCAGADSELEVQSLVSRPYVELTLEVMRAFGVLVEHDAELSWFRIKGRRRYKAREYTIEGDWSGAAGLLVAGALGGEVRVMGLDASSTQADRAVLDVLRLAGAEIEVGESVRVSRGELRPFAFDCRECPDLVPVLVALACGAKGKSEIRGAERLRVKESDRARVLSAEFSKLGARIIIEGDRLIVEGRGSLDGGTVNSHNDHRIAMACALGALVSSKPVAIEDDEAVAKSYPTFFEDLLSLVQR